MPKQRRIETIIAKLNEDGSFGFAASGLEIITADGETFQRPFAMEDIPHDHPTVLKAFGDSVIVSDKARVKADRDREAETLRADDRAAKAAERKTQIAELEAKLSALRKEFDDYKAANPAKAKT